MNTLVSIRASVADPVVVDGHIGLVVADLPFQRVIGQVVVLVEHIGLGIGAGKQGLLRQLLAHAVAGQVVGLCQSIVQKLQYA